MQNKIIKTCPWRYGPCSRRPALCWLSLSKFWGCFGSGQHIWPETKCPGHHKRPREEEMPSSYLLEVGWPKCLARKRGRAKFLARPMTSAQSGIFPTSDIPPVLRDECWRRPARCRRQGRLLDRRPSSNAIANGWIAV